MKIVWRYVLREHIGPFIAALGVLTGLLLLNQLAKRFGDLIGKGLPWYVIAEVFGLSVPFIVAMTMPMAVLVAVLYAFSRLSGDNEITAFKAGGISLRKLMMPVLLAAAVISAVMIRFNDTVLPESNHELRKLLTDISRKQPTFELRERVINEVVSGRLFLQAARIDRGRSVLWDLVIFDIGRAQVGRTIYADSGYMAFNNTQTDLYLTLFDGSMHERDSGEPNTDQLSYYGKQVIRVPGVSNELERGRSPDWRGDREMNTAMMKAEIRKRRERLGELQDSLGLVIKALAPMAAEPPTQDTIADDESALEDVSAEALATTVKRGDSDEERPDRVKPQETTPEAQALKRRFAPSRRAAWPPAGDPAAFAGQVRSELQRTASRYELQMRELNRYAVEIQKKYAIPTAAIVFVLIGAPIGVRFPRGGIGMVIGVSLAVFSVYYVFLIGGEDLADRGFLSPFWAMWGPNVLFGVLGAGILFWVTRGGTRTLPFLRAQLYGMPLTLGRLGALRLFRPRRSRGQH